MKCPYCTWTGPTEEFESHYRTAGHGENQSSPASQTNLVSDIVSFRQLIMERSRMVPLVSAGMDIAFALGSGLDHTKAEEALRLLKYALEAAVVSHDWTAAESHSASLLKLWGF